VPGDDGVPNCPMVLSDGVPSPLSERERFADSDLLKGDMRGATKKDEKHLSVSLSIACAWVWVCICAGAGGVRVRGCFCLVGACMCVRAAPHPQTLLPLSSFPPPFLTLCVMWVCVPQIL
jgi:hypothetical protein